MHAISLFRSARRVMLQWSTVRLVRRILALGLVLYLGAWAYRIVTRKYYVWLPGYVNWLFHQERPVGTPVHVFFFFVDHFEPGENAGMMERWVNEDRKSTRLNSSHL